VNPESVWGPLEFFLVLLFLVLLENFKLHIITILPDLTVDYTFPAGDCELVTLISIIFRVFTQGDDEGESSLYLV
jgi:ABC-type uncharacterized transport system permease subunit